MKGTPELKAKGIIIANNKQVSNFTKPGMTSQPLYEGKAGSGAAGGASEGTLIGNLSNQNIFYQKQKQTANFNPKTKVGSSIQQN